MHDFNSKDFYSSVKYYFMQGFIPIRIYIILFILLLGILLLFVFHFGIGNFDVKDVSSGIFIEIVGILLTLVLVERIIHKYEKNKWSELNKRIDAEINNILFFIYNIIFLHSKRMEEWIKVNNSNLTNEEKIKEYNKLLNLSNIDDVYIMETVKDDYLNKWYFDIYTNLLKRLDAIYHEFQTRLDHKQHPLFIDLKSLLTNITSNLNHFHNLADFEKNQNIKLVIDYTRDIKADIIKIISLTIDLSKTIIHQQ